MVLVSVNFEVIEDKASEFEAAWRRVFAPAISAWPGFVSCRLLRRWALDPGSEEAGSVSYRMDLRFDTEERRERWATSEEHDAAFGALTALASRVEPERYTDLVTSGAV